MFMSNYEFVIILLKKYKWRNLKPVLSRFSEDPEYGGERRARGHERDRRDPQDRLTGMMQLRN